MATEGVELLVYRKKELGSSTRKDISRKSSISFIDIENSPSRTSMESEPEREECLQNHKGSNQRLALDPRPPGEDRDEYDDNKFNIYATKKTIAQGLLDIALLTTNITQLKHMIIIGEDNHPFYHLLVICLAMSITLQVSKICFSKKCTDVVKVELS